MKRLGICIVSAVLAVLVSGVWCARGARRRI